MVEYQITINTATAAFDGAQCGSEVAHILRGLADMCERHSVPMVGLMSDSNGKVAGKAIIVGAQDFVG